ncbi:hypothetical protein IT087_03035 [Candidatus Uhrbacteria bacterium]|nr:hypothetical protein [Candidatus Uhrbacteria bacterium]
MTRSAMEVVDGLARDGTSLAVSVVGGLFIAEQIGNAMLRNDERRAEEDKVRQPLGFGCYLSAEGSMIRGEVENDVIWFQYRGVRMSAKRQDILSIHRPGEKPTCTVSLADGCRFTDVWLLSNIVIQTTAGDIRIDGSAASKWRELYGIRFGERRLIEAKREERRKAEQKLREAGQAARRQAQQRSVAPATTARKDRSRFIVPALEAAFAVFAFSVTGLFIAWSQLHL